MAIDVDSLQIEIGADSEKATEKINALKTSLSGLKRALGGKWQNPIKDIFANLGGESDKINATAEKIAKVANALNQLKSASQIKIPKGVADRLTQIGTAVQNITPEAVERLNGMAEALSRLSGVDLRGLPSAMRAMTEPGTTPSTDPEQGDVEDATRKVKEQAEWVRQLKERWREVTEAIKPIGGAIKNAGNGIANFTKNLVTAPFRGFANAVSSTVKKLQGLGRAVGRIIMYRAIRAAIKMVTEGIREGINNLYQYSAAVGTTFKDAMDTIATAGLYIKNSVGSMFAPLIEAAAPAIDAIADKVAALADMVAQLTSALTGKETYSKAIKYTTQYAEATNAAAKAVKGFLLPFDELNVMSDKSGSGTGDALDYSKMFEEAEVSGPIADFAEKVREAFATVQEYINGIDFSNIEASFGRLQEALSPLIDTISEGLGWAYENVFVPLSEWTISEAIPVTIDLIASAVNLLNEALKALQPLADWFWENILSPIAEWTGEIFIGAMESITHILDELTSLLRGDKSFGEFIDSLSTGETVALALAVAFGALAVAFGVATIATGAFTAVMAVLTSPITLVVAAIGLLIAVGVELAKHWDEISAWLGMIWDNMKKVAVMAFTAIGDFFTGLWDGIKRTFTESWNNVAHAFITAWDDIVNGIKTAWDGVWGFIKGILNAIIGGIEGWVNGIINSINFVLGGISAIASAIGGLIGLGPVDLKIQPVKLPRLAEGGVLNAGQMFIAREAGPELVANIGNRTAVMNNDQIVDSVEDGVARANDRVVSALYAVGNAIVEAIEENGGSLDDVSLARAVNRGTMRLARMGGV